MNGTPPSEKARANPRLPVDLRASVQEAAGPVLRGQTFNLSNSGAGIALASRIVARRAVRVILHLRWGDLPLLGTVMWSDEEPLAGAFGYRQGIKFTREQPGAFALDDFIHELIAAQP